MNRDQYLQLCDELLEHNKLYYVDCNPKISDFEFDQLLKKLIEVEQKNPEWIVDYSPTQRVGNSLSEGFQTVPHDIPMLSLPNTYTRDEITEFFKRVEKNLEGVETDYCLELKMDGTAISVTYEKGMFLRALTRGNGLLGEDVTLNMKTVSELPLKLLVDNPPDILEVRGEVYLDLKRFMHLNKQREADGLPLWANPRNAAAGSLKLLNPKEAAKRGLRVVFYAMVKGPLQKVHTQFEVHEYLKELGLPTLCEVGLAKNEKQVWSFCDRIEQLRKKLPYEIDGVVIKVNGLKKQAQMGSTAKIPRWASAYKFAPEQGITQITDIIVNVGRTGALTPVALLNPVKVAGSTISRVTLHNQDEVDRKDVRIGDTVIIEKGGDVIPKLVEVDLSKRIEGAAPWQTPTRCPSCHQKVVRLKGEVAYRCMNRACKERVYRHLVFFVSKEAMEIEHMGVKALQQLYDKGFVRRPSDIYRLDEKTLLSLEGFKSKSAQKLLKSIESSKKRSLAKFIMALDIRYIGQSTAEDMAFYIDNILDLKHKSVEDLKAIEGVGEKAASSIYEYFQDPINQKEIKEMLELGVSPKKPDLAMDHPFKGKIFVITGSLLQMSRAEATQKIKERGGKVSSSLSQKTNYLILGESPGSKYEKAKLLKTPILNEDDFLNMLKPF